MGRTIPSISQAFLQEEAAFARFRRALRRSDQLALDDLFNSARPHLAAVQFASHALPFEVILLAMLLSAPCGAETANGGLRPPRLVEEHKEVMKLKEKVEASDPGRKAASLPGF